MFNQYKVNRENPITVKNKISNMCLKNLFGLSRFLFYMSKNVNKQTITIHNPIKKNYKHDEKLSPMNSVSWTIGHHMDSLVNINRPLGGPKNVLGHQLFVRIFINQITFEA